MSGILEFLKIIVFGLVEGFTEWLPISSTGHLILVENIVHLRYQEWLYTMGRYVWEYFDEYCACDIENIVASAESIILGESYGNKRN